MGYAFISYNANDRASADKLLRILAKNNIDTWIAPDDIPAGTRYAQVLNKAIKKCGCCIVLLTAKSVESQWVSKEVERAIDHKKPIVPIKLEDVELTDELALYISTDQILTIHHFDEKSSEMQNLLNAVQIYTRASADDKESLLADIFENRNAEDFLPKSTPSKTNVFAVPKWLIVCVCALVLTLGIVLAVVVFGGKGKGPDAELPSADTQQTTQTNVPTDTWSETTVVTTVSTEPSTTSETITTTTTATAPAVTAGENQIPSEYENNVKSLMHMDRMAKRLYTIYVREGEYATPSAASVWRDVTIYSQDTSVAIGEGVLVKGVSKGETYVVVVSSVGTSTAYCIIVE